MYCIKVNYVNANNNQKGGKKKKYIEHKENNDLYNIGIKYRTDKMTVHGYHRFYDFVLKEYKNKNINMLEIGINNGRSLRMWSDYFGKNSKIYGMDLLYSTEKSFHKNIYELIGDQQKVSDLKNITKKTGKCDFIIDDGSHVPEHQLLSFNYLFKNSLKEGGVYIIEDIETSYWSDAELYGYNINSGIKSENNIVNIFKQVVDIVNSNIINRDNINKIRSSSKIDIENLYYISYIMFAQNCIIIHKMTEKEHKQYYEKEYRFKENVKS
jgi:hypothetical protein